MKQPQIKIVGNGDTVNDVMAYNWNLFINGEKINHVTSLTLKIKANKAVQLDVTIEGGTIDVKGFVLANIQSEEKKILITKGAKVKVVKLEPIIGIFASEQLLNNRQVYAVGEVLSWVPGHGGDVWHVEHSDGSRAVYNTDELRVIEPIKEPKETPTKVNP